MDDLKEKINDMEELDSDMNDIGETDEIDVIEREYDVIKINSTMLATGWFSAYKKDNSDNDEDLDYYPLVAWANVRIRYKDGTETDKVMGMDAADDRSVDFCELDEGFVKYVNERYLEK